MAKRKLVVLTIVGHVDRAVAMRDLKGFVEEAVETWGGQRHPDDPLFGSMTVTHLSARHVGNLEVDDV